MDSHEIEQIFADEYLNFQVSLSKLNSLVLELHDITSDYDEIKLEFANIVKTRSYSARAVSSLLQKQLDIIIRMTDVNKEIAAILSDPAKASEE